MVELLTVRNLSIHFKTFFGELKAVRNIDFDINEGEIVGLVGESGCGKSITARSILRLLKTPPAFIPNGEFVFNGRTLNQLSNEEIRKIRGKEISMIFQEPMTSLNPVFRVGEQVAEAVLTHKKEPKKEVKKRVIDVFKSVGIPDAERRYAVFPHQLSGGLRQRVMIAMALISNSKLLIADEPTTALDVTIQSQILKLIKDARDAYGMSVLLITHDLGVISEVAEKVYVMYAGKIVEETSVEKLINHPKHPYSVGLINSIPRVEQPHKKGVRLNALSGKVPELFEIPIGCPFNNRCEKKMEICEKQDPPLKKIEDNNKVACWLYNH
ncbi:MAG: ABC transporter ATP-binding protein [Thermotogota bacterium]|nr:ABC transporter ATP-binding protein [Thermotogota bacterium]